MDGEMLEEDMVGGGNGWSLARRLHSSMSPVLYCNLLYVVVIIYNVLTLFTTLFYSAAFSCFPIYIALHILSFCIK